MQCNHFVCITLQVLSNEQATTLQAYLAMFGWTLQAFLAKYLHGYL